MAKATAELVEVEADQDEAPQPNGLRIATLDVIRALVKEQRGAAPLVHTDPATGFSFKYRPLTGSQRAQARASAVKTGSFLMMEFERQVAQSGMVEPRYDDTYWVALGGVVGGMREGLLNAIQEASGMTGDPVADAKKGSTPTEESDDSGTA